MRHSGHNGLTKPTADGEAACRDLSQAALITRLQSLRDELCKAPYGIYRHINLAHTFEKLGYPDLAAGAYYKAILLLDALHDESDDLHDAVTEEYNTLNDRGVLELELELWEQSIYTGLVKALLSCACYKSAWRYCQIGLRKFSANDGLLNLAQEIEQTAMRASSCTKPDEWPDQGFVRRELYPWNSIEPDRFSDESLRFLNSELTKVAPDLEVRTVDLLDLTDSGVNDSKQVVKQLGVIARCDIEPGKQILEESSILTVNNRLNDTLCDACSAEIINSSSAVECDDCRVVFCSDKCLEEAMQAYHPAVCDRGLESLARDVPPAQAADSLYLLLCVRALALSVTQDVHPLALKEVKYIWGDYQKDHTQSGTLPFSFEMNIVMPFDVLTKMDIDIFAHVDRFDVWVFNALYAKFRGTASARLSGRNGTMARGPEVSAVHPLWCLVNHSCDPNVRWEWGAQMRFWARTQRVAWQDGIVKNSAGLQKGQEVLSHYCDIELPVQQRREWAQGALGGDCRCDRCDWEASH